ncbi:putative ATP-binding protein involved in virulence [Phenylobacterium haematophilum]|uniref:Putative ATP-binding protein involved in virulence n=1 Tax=Phenylobacterium haematophilum TaxID=98513 RepID=A0A840A4R9_9CAUL|nr:AAA family ATPase [Phenylobacterium haematophilum]MBB3892372.1 putative ATP-binding protein involved in virulence [Phenylobacterium haematophilum]
MKLLNFVCRGLNGYLDFDLSFRKDVSFLIGINGSGKTSVLKAIMALLGPDIDWLMNARYDSILVDLEHEDAHLVISAIKSNNNIQFSFSNGDDFSSVTISDEIYRNSLRIREDLLRDSDGDYIRVRESVSEITETMAPFQAVRGLPTPIFLGLDRTSLPTSARSNQRQRRAPPPKRTHATLRAFLDESVAQAEAIAIEAAKQAQVLRTRRASELREQILLSLFSEGASRGSADLPRSVDIRRYEKARKSLKAAFTALGIDTARVEQTIDPFFSEVIGVATALSKHKNLEVIIAKSDDNTTRNFISWMRLEPRVSLIKEIEEFVNNFNDAESEIFRHTNRYLSIMNSFLEDSRKTLSFKEDASLIVKLPSGEMADVYHLSSGERQLFVLITSLMFNDDQRRASAVIIDEPELSLHIKWQEMFVDSLLEANPDIQLILATHSPSIILDRDENCVDLA